MRINLNNREYRFNTSTYSWQLTLVYKSSYSRRWDRDTVRSRRGCCYSRCSRTRSSSPTFPSSSDIHRSPQSLCMCLRVCMESLRTRQFPSRSVIPYTPDRICTRGSRRGRCRCRERMRCPHNRLYSRHSNHQCSLQAEEQCSFSYL